MNSKQLTYIDYQGCNTVDLVSKNEKKKVEIEDLL